MQDPLTSLKPGRHEVETSGKPHPGPSAHVSAVSFSVQGMQDCALAVCGMHKSQRSELRWREREEDALLGSCRIAVRVMVILPAASVV